MTKNILVVYYSQSGQLKNIAEKVTAPLEEKGLEIEWMAISPTNNFPFPWNSKKFFNAMPESVMCIPEELNTPAFKREHYDLILFCYQPWFLSPSIPASSILQHPEFKKRLLNTPLITIIGARNMWLSAQEKIKRLLKQTGANLVGNIVMTDRHNNFVSAITIQYWMFTGKKDKFLGIFPEPGVSEKDINTGEKFGLEILKSLETNIWQDLQERLVNQGAVEVQTNLMFIEGRAPAIFKIWATTILKKKNRNLWLQIFKYYLLFALFVIAPILMLVYNIAFRPFTAGKIKRNKTYYSGVTLR